MTTALARPVSRTRARAGAWWQRPSRRPVLLIWALLVAPMVWWTIHLLWVGWIPQGDEALIAIRSHDVFSTHPPLLGMRSTSAINTPGVYAHHPGPMEFYVLATPYLLSGWHPWGLLLGCLLTMIVFVAVSLHAAYHAAGLSGVAIATWVIVVIEVVFGASLVLPLNAWPPVLGLLAVLMLAWRLVLGSPHAMPWYAVCASYVAQAHLSFAPMVGLLTVALGVLGVVRWRRRRESIWPMPGFHVLHRTPWWRRRGWVTAYLTALCWLPVAVEVFVSSPNNVTELSRIATAPSKATVGAATSVQNFVEMLAPPWLPGLARTAVGAGVLLLAAVAAWQTLRSVRQRGFDPRRTDTRLGSLLAVATVCCVSLIWVGSRVQGGITLLYLDLLWAAPLVLSGCAVWWVLALLWDRLPPQSPLEAGGRRVVVVLAVGVSLLIGSHTGAFLALTDYWKTVAQTRGAVPQMADALDRPALRHRPVVVRWSGGLSWASMAPALEAELVARGRDVYFDGVWPNPEYDDFRRIRNAPANAVVVLLRERSSPQGKWSQTEVPASSRTMIFRLQTGDGQGQLQMRIQKAPFSPSAS